MRLSAFARRATKEGHESGVSMLGKTSSAVMSANQYGIARRGVRSVVLAHCVIRLRAQCSVNAMFSVTFM